MSKKIAPIFCVILLQVFSLDFAAAKVTGFFDFNYYYDTRDSNVQTINLLIKPHPKFEYFTFLNYFNQSSSEDNFDKSLFFTEQNLRYQMGESIFDSNLQAVTQSGDNNDVLRLGVRARLTSLETIKNIFAKRFAYFIVIHFAQFDKLSGYNWQIEHVYRITLVPDLIFISGFLDHNILRAGNRFVGEHQFSIRLFEGLFAHVEYRSNDFMPTENTGWGIGLGYLSRF